MAYKDEWKINFSAIYGVTNDGTMVAKPVIGLTTVPDWKDAINRVYG